MNEVLSVSQAREALNETLALAVPALIIEGEVSGYSINRSKFVFFDLKDDDALLSCFMMAFAQKFPLEDGMRVRVIAEPTITARGKFSLTIRAVQPVGEGSLKKAFELLKASLEKESLFAPERKRQLPDFPHRIGVVSSEGAAGWADFSKIVQQRWSGLSIELADVGVQGLHAPDQVIAAIEWFNQQAEPVEVLVVIRGGGSSEDLAVFNHEGVVRAVAASRIPTIVGIGHEVDESLAELAADVRASTPSNAAQIVVPEKQSILQRLEKEVAAAAAAMKRLLVNTEADIEMKKHDLQQTMNDQLSLMQQAVHAHRRLVAQFNPEAVLKRGYGIISAHKHIITSVKTVKIGENIDIALKDGEIGATVYEKR